MEKPFTKKDEDRLKICTDTILEALHKQFDGGVALLEVHENKLYRRDFKTFEDYCQAVLKISQSRAYQLMDAAKVVESLPEKVAEKITNERQARALVSVPEKDRTKIIKLAEKSGELTAESIAEAVKSSTTVETNHSIKPGKTEKTPVEFDECGTPIPKDGLPYWHRRQEVQDILTQISRIKGLMEKAKSDEDNLYGIVSNAVIADLSKAYTHISEAKPYAVCTQCMGSPSVQPKGCSMCGNSGMISKFKWDNVSRKEIKELRLKANRAHL